MKKICLIEPKAPGYNIYTFWPLPRLGLPIMGAILKKRGYEVKIYLQEFSDINYDDVFRSDIVGISTTTSTVPEAYRIAKKVKERGIPVMMGGVHVTFEADEALDFADYVIRGEGEETIVELLEAIKTGGSLENIAGLSYKTHGIKKHNPDRPLLENLDALPFPDLSLIDNNESLKFLHAPIMTSRGCPFDCTFCSVTQMFGRGYRVRGIESVMEEIKAINRNNYPFIFFYDDNFTADRNRTKALLETMIQKNLVKKEWSAQVRIDVAKDKELLGLMKRTKCTFLYIGFESVNPRTLELYNKQQKAEDMKKYVKILHEYNIKINGMFVLGSDEDTARTVRETVEFAKEAEIDTIQFLILTPLPGSKIYRQLESQNRLFSKEWEHYDGHHVVFYPNKMTPHELQTETIKAMRDFYSFSHNAKRLLKSGDWKWFFYKCFAKYLIKKWERINRHYYTKLKSKQVQT